jgi:uncharacterized protein (DUF2267 family)
MKYEEFISKVRSRASLTTQEQAVLAARATLEALAERLEGHEVEHLAAQLPPELGLYLQLTNEEKGEGFSLDEFFQRVSRREGVNLVDAEYHARVVLALIAETVSMGEIEDVRSQLPPEFAHLFDVQNAGEIPEIGKVAETGDEL